MIRCVTFDIVFRIANDRRSSTAPIDPSTAPLVLKIADFGFARELTESLADTVCGSPLYMAPEVLRGDRYSELADLWSVGAILFDLLCGAPPFQAESPQQLSRMLANNPVVFPAHVVLSREARALTLSLLRKNSAERASWEQFVNDVWLHASLPADAAYVEIRDTPLVDVSMPSSSSSATATTSTTTSTTTATTTAASNSSSDARATRSGGALPQARASSPVAVVDVGRGASPNDVVRRG